MDAREPKGAGGERGQSQQATADRVDRRRRRLTQGLVGGVPVVMTLAHRPVWANVNCTASAVASANSSLNPGWETCALGCSAAFWRGEGNVRRVGDVEWNQAWQDTGVSPSASFARVFRLGEIMEPDELAQWDDIAMADAVSGNLGFGMMDVGTEALMRECLFQTAAAYLNASHPVIASGYSVNGSVVHRDDIVNAFHRAYEAYRGGGKGSGGARHGGQSGGGSGVITGQSRISSLQGLSAFADQQGDPGELQSLSDELAEANNQVCVLDARNYAGDMRA
ncbi:hypothetical protein [Aquisalimonas asiatica]|uniref:Uncharacterized protein n=1 Tax=Aquisalimonas asiatica TaxID=406100 RepID=A0A1H8QHK6_9GAMM|nr:hypothetical protein [Aquisalimonas asiatica]SEO53394.1 hypothetical protein SAMN04488052_101576 [Aquisalimonas asiatica]